jgi:oxygen-independent coproporphyrinogen-3 oxidase
MERYHHALCDEIITFGDKFQQNHGRKIAVNTLFMGGGTPSTYPDALLLDMLGTLIKVVDLQESAEVTIEVNPGTVREEQLEVWRTAGINRLSIGVQSLNDAVLKGLNRHQSAEDVYALLTKASRFFDNLSIDLILGLPGISELEWRNLISTVVTWPIKHISIYFLTVHEHTPLYFKVKSKAVTLPLDDGLVDLYHWSIETLKTHGFNQYEISNFAREGYESRHNQIYWERKPYKGFGLGAWSFNGDSRMQNQKNLTRYLEGLEKQEDITVFSEQLTQEQIKLETVMLGLRRTKGVLKRELYEGRSPELLDAMLDDLKARNLIRENEHCLILTPAGLAVENEIVTKLLS